uniref:Uncharacterized protein n=1 Tax=Alexandrium catenella TaxID=2925 RepID=A0A7S1KV98_ALECA
MAAAVARGALCPPLALQVPSARRPRGDTSPSARIGGSQTSRTPTRTPTRTPPRSPATEDSQPFPTLPTPQARSPGKSCQFHNLTNGTDSESDSDGTGSSVDEEPALPPAARGAGALGGEPSDAGRAREEGAAPDEEVLHAPRGARTSRPPVMYQMSPPQPARDPAEETAAADSA